MRASGASELASGRSVLVATAGRQLPRSGGGKGRPGHSASGSGIALYGMPYLASLVATTADAMHVRMRIYIREPAGAHACRTCWGGMAIVGIREQLCGREQADRWVAFSGARRVYRVLEVPQLI